MLSLCALPLLATSAPTTCPGSPGWIEPTPVLQRAADFQVLARTGAGTVSPVVELGAAGQLRGSAAAGAGFHVAEIAAEADFEFFQACGASLPATVAEIEARLATCAELFETGPGITFEVTAIIVQVSEPDPYTATNVTVLLNQFRTNWVVQHADIRRDLAHLFTGKNLAGSVLGAAFIGTVCNPDLAFSVSSPKGVSEPVSSLITCKEIARVFGAPNCDVQPDCGLMCSAFGGCSGDPAHFGASTSATILANALAGGCLDDPAQLPQLTSLSPAAGPAFGTGPVSLHGSFLSGTTEVDFGGVSVPFAVASDLEVQVVAPLATSLGPVDVTLTTSDGTSAPLPFTYVVTSPPGLAAPSASIPGELFEWTLGADPLDFYALFVQVGDGTTLPFGPWSLLATPTFVSLGDLGAAGTEITGAVAPSLGGVDLFFQAWFFDDVGLGFSGATNVTFTLGV